MGWKAISIGAVAGCLAAGSAGAQLVGVDAVPGDIGVDHAVGGDKNIIVGLGLGVNPDYEGSEDYRLVPLWLIRANNLFGAPTTYVQILATQLKSNFLKDPNWRLGFSGEFVPERDDVQNDRVDDLSSASESLLLGVIGGYDYQLGEGRTVGAELNARYDVVNGNGYLVTAGATYAMPIDRRMRFSTGINTTYASSDYMENYFGIDGGNAQRSGLDQYDADAGFKDAAVTAGLTYGFTESWRVSVLGRYKRLLNDAKDSPITDDEGSANQFFGGLMANYAF